MEFNWTKSSTNALNEIKIIMIDQYNKKIDDKIKIKFTKKKEFLAIPMFWLMAPAFQLFINERLYCSYVFRDNKWSKII